MRDRCQNPKNTSYKNYGGKGVKVCEDWDLSFLKFKEWADANGYNDTLTCDREDSNGDYCPGNCRWLPLGKNVSRAILKSDSKISDIKVDNKEARNKLIQICKKEGKTLTEMLGELIENKYQELFVT